MVLITQTIPRVWGALCQKLDKAKYIFVIVKSQYHTIQGTSALILLRFGSIGAQDVTSHTMIWTIDFSWSTHKYTDKWLVNIVMNVLPIRETEPGLTHILAWGCTMNPMKLWYPKMFLKVCASTIHIQIIVTKNANYWAPTPPTESEPLPLTWESALFTWLLGPAFPQPSSSCVSPIPILNPFPPKMPASKGNWKKKK